MTNQEKQEMSKRILCIGERPEILMLMRDILEYEGYEVVLRGVPFQEIAEIEALSPDLVALGLTPFADNVGRRTLTLLNEKPDTTAFPVLVFLGAPEDLLEQDRYLMRERVFFVAWPFDNDRIVTLIQRALQTRLFQRM